MSNSQFKGGRLIGGYVCFFTLTYFQWICGVKLIVERICVALPSVVYSTDDISHAANAVLRRRSRSSHFDISEAYINGILSVRTRITRCTC